MTPHDVGTPLRNAGGLASAALARERQHAARQSIAGLVTALAGNDAAALFRALQAIEVAGTLPAALRRVAKLNRIRPNMQRAFLAIWTHSGDALRSEAGHDRHLLDGLRVLLPRYTGPALTLYRGDSLWNRRRRSYGLAWSARVEVADAFARGWWRSCQGGSVVLRAEAPAGAILCAVHGGRHDAYKEAEYLVDRRRLGRVDVVSRYPQTVPALRNDVPTW